MKSFIKFSSAMTAILVLFIAYSCNKENVQPVPTEQSNVTVENRSTVLCEEAQGLCTGDYIEETLIFPNGIPSYPNCTMSIVVKWRVCPAGLDMVYVGPIGISSTNNDPDCLQAQLDTNDPLTAPAALEVMEKELLEQALIQLGLEEMTASSPIPICGENPSLLLRMTRAACAKACVFPDPNDPRGLSFIFLPCGNNCCQSTFELCFDLATGKVKLTQTSNAIPATPCEVNPLSLPCPRNTIFSTSCRPRCANIAQGG